MNALTCVCVTAGSITAEFATACPDNTQSAPHVGSVRKPHRALRFVRCSQNAHLDDAPEGRRNLAPHGRGDRRRRLQQLVALDRERLLRRVQDLHEPRRLLGNVGLDALQKTPTTSTAAALVCL